jgi:hypothetical protein
MPLRSERTDFSGGAAAMDLGAEEEAVEGSTEKKSRAERGILSCTRLQVCATYWDEGVRLPSSRTVHWYDGRVMGKRIYKKEVVWA